MSDTPSTTDSTLRPKLTLTPKVAAPAPAPEAAPSPESADATVRVAPAPAPTLQAASSQTPPALAAAAAAPAPVALKPSFKLQGAVHPANPDKFEPAFVSPMPKKADGNPHIVIVILSFLAAAAALTFAYLLFVKNQ